MSLFSIIILVIVIFMMVTMHATQTISNNQQEMKSASNSQNDQLPTVTVLWIFYATSYLHHQKMICLTCMSKKKIVSDHKGFLLFQQFCHYHAFIPYNLFQLTANFFIMHSSYIRAG